MYIERDLKLYNKQGNALEICIRKYRYGDEAGMIECICEEYEDTYSRTDFYNPEYIRMSDKDGNVMFFVAQTKFGEIAAMMCLRPCLEKGMCEIAAQVVKKKYRGYGIAAPFFEYTLKILKQCSYLAAYCQPVVFHTITQRLLYKLGLHGTGFMLNEMSVNEIIHSYPDGRNQKHSFGIQIMAMQKKDAGTLYLPKEHSYCCSQIYDKLGVKYNIAEKADAAKSHVLINKSEIICKNDSKHQSMELCINQIGADLEETVDNMEKQNTSEGMQTVNILININNPFAVWGYERLAARGYFFTGLYPLCENKEYMILHNPGKVNIYFDEFKVTNDFCILLEYVRKCYESRVL